MEELEEMVIQEPKVSLPRRIIKGVANNFNFKAGAFFGPIGGGIVYAINHTHGFVPAIKAASVEFGYTFFAGSFNIKVCERATNIPKSRRSGIAAGIIVPTLTSVALKYTFQKAIGTPEAIESAIWAIPLNIPICYGFARHYRNKLEKTISSSSQKL